MDATSLSFRPFYSRTFSGEDLRLPAKIVICLLTGLAYTCILLYYLDKQELFYQHKLWLLGTISGTALFCLYVATNVFKRLLPVIDDIHNKECDAQAIIDHALSDKWFMASGCFFAIVNSGLGYFYGVPLDYAGDADAVTMLYVGFFLAGFFCGMAVWGIVGIIVVFNRMAADFSKSFDYHDPDGCGGTLGIGAALVVFGVVTMLVGVLISIYLTAMPWSHRMESAWVQLVLWSWIVFPYLMSAIVVAVPAFTLVQQLGNYKLEQRRRLNGEIQQLMTALENPASTEDVEGLHEKLASLREELKILHAMSISPINRETGVNFIAAMLPNIFGSSIALTSIREILNITA